MIKNLPNGSDERSEQSPPGSVPARVAEAVQGMIRERGLKPGDALPSQRELAALLGASRPSVREGLSMLETLGFLRVEERRGLFVADPGDRPPAAHWRFAGGYSLREVYQFRIALEPAALALALPGLTAGDLDELQRLTQSMLAGARQGQPVRAAECDTLFHDVIFSRCPNRLYQDVRRQLSREMQDSQWVPMVILDQVRETAREHFAIVEAIRFGHGEEACALMEAHIKAAARRVNTEI